MIPLNLLIAFPYASKNVLASVSSLPAERRRLIIDSGAFTAWTTGKPIVLDDYCRFLDTLESLRPFKAVQLDVFGDPEGTYENYRTMRARGYDVMPVFTRGDTKERLDEFYQYTDYVMFGGIATGGRNQNYVKWFLSQNGGRKAHWLGFCRLDFIKAYRPFSVDSSSWSAGPRFGVAHLYAGGGLLCFAKADAQKAAPSPAIYRAARRMGLADAELLLLQKELAWRGGVTEEGYQKLRNGQLDTAGLHRTLCALSHVLLAHDCEKALGTRYFLAVGQHDRPNLVLAAHAFLRARKVIP